MSCYIEGCRNELCFICDDCYPKIYFCEYHPAYKHSEETDHYPRILKKEENESIEFKEAKILIHRYIGQIQKFTQEIIHSLEKTCKKIIQNLKIENRNIQSISNLKVPDFHTEIINCLITQTGIISEVIKINFPSQISELQQKILERSRSLNILAGLEEKEEQKEMGISPGYIYLGFNQMKFKEKCNYVRKNWRFVKIYSYSTEFFISSDEKYLFHCNHHKGTKD